MFLSGNGLTESTAVKIGNDGKFYVVSSGSGEILRFNANGTFDLSFCSLLGLPMDLIQDSNNNWYVSDQGSRSVLQFDGSGTRKGLFATAGGLSFPGGLALAGGNLLVGNYAGVSPGPGFVYGSGVLMFDSNGRFSSVLYSGGFLDGPFAMAFL